MRGGLKTDAGKNRLVPIHPAIYDLIVKNYNRIDLNEKTFTVARAKLGDTKLPVGTYAAGDAALGGFVSDAAGSGSLVVKGEGLQILFR